MTRFPFGRICVTTAAAAEKADVLLSDFSAWLKLEIKEGTVQKAFAYLTKSTQESDEDY